MNSNPWNVGSIDDFSYLNCPECTFHTKGKTYFQDHAKKNHPLSSVLFGSETKVISFSCRNDLNQLKKLTIDQKCQDLASKFKLPSKIQISLTPSEASKRKVEEI